MEVLINKIFVAKNVSKSLAVDVNILISLINKRYAEKIDVDGDPKPGLKKDSLENIFVRYRFKEIKPKESFPMIMSAEVVTKKIDYSDLLFQDKRYAQSKKKQMLVYPEGLRRIRKIAERLFNKSKLIIDFEKEITGFIKRNFKIMNESDLGNENQSDLEKLIHTNMGTVRDIISFAIALHKHNKIHVRRVMGLKINSTAEKHYWIEIKVGKNWVPVDVINGYYGYVPDDFLALKIDYSEKIIQDYQTVYKLNKHWMGSAIVVLEDQGSVQRVI